ncbi:MAG: NAD-dependent epimerase/dehydratase family protein [Blastocatellia bacterium]|nr:NAD-dependent epimerase/dehydratase family protein [Blastocatellia bacterium]
MAKTLVTGGTGFLGTHLLNLLLEEAESEIRVLTTGDGKLLDPSFEVVNGSVLSKQDLLDAVEGVDHIYHLAGKVSRNPEDKHEMYAIHVEGTRNLCEAAKKAGVKRIVLASTSGTIAVTEKGEEVPDETYPTPIDICSRWPYYASKIYQEETARRGCGDKVELVILNPSLLLGPGDSRLSSTQDILKFLGKDIPAMPSGGINFVDVRDVAKTFVAAMKQGRAGECYLLGGPNWTFEKFFARLERLTNVSAPKFRAPAKLGIWGAKVADAFYRHWDKVPPLDVTSVEMAEYFWYLDPSKAERELGFVSRDPSETLYDTVKYLKETFMSDNIFSK